MQFKYLFFLLILLSPLFAEDEIVVQVTTESTLPLLYVDSIEDQKSGLDRAYLNQLENVLRFDLSHSGAATLVAKNPVAEQQVKKEKGWKTFDPSGWQQQQVQYVVKVKIAQKQLSASAFDVKKNAIKGIEGIALSGALNADRRTLHQLADTIYETLFHKKGIASSRILYTVRKGTALKGETDVWEADYDGENARQVTKDGCLCVTPAYVPFKTQGHCRQFTYVSYKIGQPKLFISSLDGEAKRLSLLKGNQLMPAFSPRKDLVAFISDVTGNPELFIQSYHPEKGLVGGPRQIFAAPNGAQASPTFSPDGKKIAFVSNKDGAPRIYAISIPSPEQSLKTVKATLLTKQNRDNTCPAWSPDGSKIAYSSSVKGIRQIWIYDFKTGQETPLTEGGTHKENPAWAADSLHLLFNSSSTTGAELYLINLNQKEAIKISKGSGEKRFPVWEP